MVSIASRCLFEVHEKFHVGAGGIKGVIADDQVGDGMGIPKTIVDKAVAFIDADVVVNTCSVEVLAHDGEGKVIVMGIVVAKFRITAAVIRVEPAMINVLGRAMVAEGLVVLTRASSVA